LRACWALFSPIRLVVVVLTSFDGGVDLNLSPSPPFFIAPTSGRLALSLFLLVFCSLPVCACWRFPSCTKAGDAVVILRRSEHEIPHSLPVVKYLPNRRIRTPHPFFSQFGLRKFNIWRHHLFPLNIAQNNAPPGDQAPPPRPPFGNLVMSIGVFCSPHSWLCLSTKSKIILPRLIFPRFHVPLSLFFFRVVRKLFRLFSLGGLLTAPLARYPSLTRTSPINLSPERSFFPPATYTLLLC